MPTLQALYEIQAIDLDLAERRARVEAIRIRLGDDAALAAMRARLTELGDSIRALATQQKQYEDQIAALAVRIANAEAQLYGGSVRNPRELQDLQADVAQLNRQRDDQEFHLLEVTEELDPLETERHQTQERLASVEAQWREEQASLTAELAELEERIATLDARRTQQAVAIPPVELALYDRIRGRHPQGRGIAKVHNRMCESCRVGLPVQMSHDLRTSSVPIRCPSCGLILMLE